MFVFIIPLLLILVAPIVQLILSARRIRGQSKLPIALIFLLSVLFAAGLAALAFTISLYSLPADIKCASGCTGFIALGLFNVCFVIPLIGIISLITYYKTNQQPKSLT